MTIETKYNIGDEVWFTYLDEVPHRGVIDGIDIRHRINYPTNIVYVVKFRKSLADITDITTDKHEDSLFTNPDEYIGKLNQAHTDKVKCIREAMAARASFKADK